MKNKLPHRHRNHEIESLSERFLKNIVPVSYVLNKIQLDYGTDYNCEIVKDGLVTGHNFSIQLKGKEYEAGDEHITIKNLKRSTINRWLSRLEPTMLVVFIIDENEGYWTWFENNTVDLTKDNTSFTLRIPRTRKFSQINWGEIEDRIKTIFSRRNLLYKLPEDQESIGWQHYFKHEFAKALPLLKDLNKSNTDGVLLNAIAICEYNLYNYQSALIHINKALEIQLDNIVLLNKASILTEQGTVNNDQKKIIEAIKIYETIIQEGGVEDSLLYNYGSALLKLNKLNEALEAFSKAIAINPNRPEIWNNLANVYLTIGNHSAEIECYDSALKINPFQPETLFSKGSSLFRFFGKTDEGLELMLKASHLSNLPINEQC